MAFLPSRAIVVVVLLIFLTRNQVDSSDLYQELRTTLAVSQIALAHQSQALSQLLERQKRNELDTQGISQALAHQSQALSRLLQRQEWTEQTNVAENIQTSLRIMIDELAERLTTLLNKQSETMNQAVQGFCQTLPQGTTPSSETLPQGTTLSSETLPQGTTPSSETLPQVTTSYSSSVPREAEVVSDGVFMAVKERMTWMEARDKCHEIGGYLAFPPSDMEAFRIFIFNSLEGGKEAWLGGREEGSRGYMYLDGTPVNSQHWLSGQPDSLNSCLLFYTDWERPLFDWECSYTFPSICRFG